MVQFILVDSETGKARILLEEQSDSFIFTDLYNLGFGAVNIRWINKSNDFIWHSERDGWSHLYLYDGNTGQLKNRITSGEWGVRQIISVDEEKEWLYFTAEEENLTVIRIFNIYIESALMELNSCF